VLQKVLRRHSDALRQAALAILKTESLTGQEIRDIMAEHPPQDPPHMQVCLAAMTYSRNDTACPKVSDAACVYSNSVICGWLLYMLSCSCLTNKKQPDRLSKPSVLVLALLAAA